MKKTKMPNLPEINLSGQETDSPLPSLKRRGICFVIAAPSGGGKSSVARALVTQDPELHLSVSATTRPPRGGEEHGKHYFFYAHEEFSRLIAENGFLEYAEVFGNLYGTPKAEVLRQLEAGRDIIFDIDWQGYRTLQEALPGDVVGIFILPPCLSVLWERLRRRGDNEQDIQSRMSKALDEISHAGEFPHILINNDFQKTLAEAKAVLTAARTQTTRLLNLPDFMQNL